MIITDEMFERFVEKYTELQERSDLKYDRAVKAENEGKLEKAKALYRDMEEVDSRIIGMEMALEIFGYNIILHADDSKELKYVIVEE